MKTYHFLISGNVQGVGYRQFVKQQAKKLGLTGWVRNLPVSSHGFGDGTVEAAIQGEKERINQLQQACKKGPLLAEVKDIVVTEAETQEVFVDFLIAPTPETI